ncbi:MAG: PD40 domain-containing protein [Bacteroidales bacterium]|nr:PD40 domain-containing protein [Bacteroidales bacterium]
MKSIRKVIYIISSVFLCYGVSAAQGLQFERNLGEGDSLRMKYCFEASVETYLRALEYAQDSLSRLLVEDRILLSENGKTMSEFVYEPQVVARHKFSIQDFYLYYPLKDKAWHKVPNVLDSLSGGIVNALYAPEGDEVIYYSAADKDGIRNIYMTSRIDSLWTVPALLNEHMTSASDEVYPLLSADGKSLYFSSSGLYGVGGYDLYVSHWDDDVREWSVPVNLGFPYSSPADDFLFMDDENSGHTLFASNRNCSPDSIWVYVLKFDNMPVRRELKDPEKLRSLAELSPDRNEKFEGNEEIMTDIPMNRDIERYMEHMEKVRELRDSMTYYMEVADEKGLSDLQSRFDESMKVLQKIEMDLLFKGVVIDPDQLQSRADSEIVAERNGFAFTKKSMGKGLEVELVQPEPSFDYSFKILPQGQFAEDNALPGGIVYQIQIFSTVTKAGIKNLKGLSPVFEHRTSSGRYTYRVGLFRTYNDVLSNLNAVKKVGFRSAFIVAFIDGKEVSVANARTKEKDVSEKRFYEVHVRPLGGDIDRVLMEAISQQADGKDVAKVVDDDGVFYVIGPFADKDKAGTLATFVKAMGIGDVSVVQMIKK